MEKKLDSFSAVLYLSGYEKIEEPISQMALKQILENRKNFKTVKLKILQIMT